MASAKVRGLLFTVFDYWSDWLVESASALDAQLFGDVAIYRAFNPPAMPANSYGLRKVRLAKELPRIYVGERVTLVRDIGIVQEHDVSSTYLIDYFSRTTLAA